MKRTTQAGFGQVLIVLILAGVVAAYFVKDESGVSYLDKGVHMIRYYTIDRNVDAVQKATQVKATAQAQQDRLQEELNKQ